MGQAMSELGDPNELDEDSQEGQEEGGAQSPGRSDGNGRSVYFYCELCPSGEVTLKVADPTKV